VNQGIITNNVERTRLLQTGRHRRCRRDVRSSCPLMRADSDSQYITTKTRISVERFENMLPAFQST